VTIFQDVDEDAPTDWKNFMQPLSPESFECLDESSKTEITRWNAQRAVLIQKRMQQELESKLEELGIDGKPSIPFLRVRVSSVVHEQNETSFTQSDAEEAILTIWNPSNEQLDALQEGSIIRAQYLDTKSSCNLGLMQLTGGPSTSMIPPPFAKLKSSAVQPKRKYFSLFSVLQLSQKHWKDSSKQHKLTVTVVGLLLKVQKIDELNDWLVYLTDKSQLILRVYCVDICGKLGLFLKGCAPNFDAHIVIEFGDICVMPFDFDECCSVAQYCGDSTFLENPRSRRARTLQEWSKTDNGIYNFKKFRAYMNVGIQEVIASRPHKTKAVGYIVGLHVLPCQPLLILNVDCGSSTLQSWRLPLALITAFTESYCYDPLLKDTVLNEAEEKQLTKLTKIGHIFGARKKLFCFTLQRIPVSPNLPRHCEFEVSNVFSVDTSALAALYLQV
jgi:hypothetical protein